MASAPLVLIVEDEPIIREMLEGELVEAGYVVAKAVSGEEAIALLEREGARVRALVTDINLGVGKKTGWEVAMRARELQPETPVVYMTGTGADDWAAHGVPNSILINKPFAPVQVVTAISQLLNIGSQSTS